MALTFTELSPEDLNDLRRKVVNNEEVTDEELRNAIQTLRMQNHKPPAAKKKAAARTSVKKEAASLDFGDLLEKKL